LGVYQQEQDNMVRWQKGMRPFYEVYYLKLNFASRRKALWLRYTLLSPQRGLGPPTAAVWAMAYDFADPAKNFALKEIVSIDRAVIDREIFYFQILENAIYNSGARGGLSSGGHEVQWDLQFIHAEESFRPFPASFYFLPFPKTKMLAPNWSIQVEGEVVIDGEKFLLQACPASQAHFWGSRHAERWAWGHCNAFQEDGAAVFESLTSPFRLSKKRARPLTLMALRRGSGEEIKVNRLSQLLFNESRYQVGSWELQGYRGHYCLKAAIRADPALFLGLTYTDTDGSKLYCYHTELADFSVELSELRGGKYQILQTLTAASAGAFEVVERTPLPGIEIVI
jgi:hypothetical protein